MNSKNFWKNKNVLVTGHSGFKGMWLSLVLKYFDAKVSGLSLENKYSDIYKSLDSEKFFESEYFLDLSDEVKLIDENIFSDNKFDIIFHFAAQPLVSVASLNPLETLKTNILGTYNLIDLIIKFDTTKALIVATTDKVYKYSENKNDENAHLGGIEFYSSSKVGQEMIIEAFKNDEKNKNLNISTVRSGNVLGPGDGGTNRLMTDLITSLKLNTDIILRNPNSIRPWQDILDSVDGYLLVAEKNYVSNEGEIFNLNTVINNETTTREIVESMIKKWDSEINITVEQADFHESFELRIDSSKANKVLGWVGKLNIKDILDKIVQWEKNEKKLNLEDVSFEQIKTYYSI